MDAIQLLATIGVPSLIISIFMLWLTRKLNKFEKARERHENARTEHMVLLINMSYASMALGEATAISIKNEKCNGEIAEALSYVKTVKNAHKDFINHQGASNL